MAQELHSSRGTPQGSVSSHLNKLSFVNEPQPPHTRTAEHETRRNRRWGGVAGLNCARKLASNPDVRITLIDRNNFQQFQPLLYQVAAGMLTPSYDAFVLRNLFKRHANVDVKM